MRETPQLFDGVSSLGGQVDDLPPNGRGELAACVSSLEHVGYALPSLPGHERLDPLPIRVDFLLRHALDLLAAERLLFCEHGLFRADATTSTESVTQEF